MSIVELGLYPSVILENILKEQMMGYLEKEGESSEY